MDDNNEIKDETIKHEPEKESQGEVMELPINDITPEPINAEEYISEPKQTQQYVDDQGPGRKEKVAMFLATLFVAADVTLIYKSFATKGLASTGLILFALASLFLFMAEAAVILMNRRVIWNKMKMFLGKTSGSGKLKIMQNNGHFKEVITKLTLEGYRIDENQYNHDDKRSYEDIDGSKCLFYRQGDAEPIDLVQNQVPAIDSKLYAQVIDKAMSAGALSVRKNKDMLAMMALGGAVFALLAALIAFKNNGDIQTLLTAMV